MSPLSEMGRLFFFFCSFSADGYCLYDRFFVAVLIFFFLPELSLQCKN